MYFWDVLVLFLVVVSYLSSFWASFPPEYCNIFINEHKSPIYILLDSVITHFLPSLTGDCIAGDALRL